MFPLYQQVKIPGKKSWVILILILLNISLFFISLPNLEGIIEDYGLIPERIIEGEGLFTIFSSMFLHVGIGHLLGNMWFLWIFGNNLEKRLGKLKLLTFYLLCGTISALIYLILAPEKTIPAVGASGAVSGILGGYLILFPKHKIVSLVPVFFYIHLIAVPVLIFIGIWFLYQLLYIGTETSVAYWAHIAGFLSGILLIKLFAGKKKHQHVSF